MRILSFLAVASLLVVGFGFAPMADPPVKKDAAISDVMNEVMKGGLLRKVMSGDASDEEKMKVLDMLISLTENEPPTGDADEWQARTSRIVINYGKFIVGREGADAALRESTNCKSCHDQFRE